MKKTLTYITLSLITWMGVQAEVLSPDAALERAAQSGQYSFANPGTRAMSDAKLKMTFKAMDGQPALYVFDNHNANSFVVVSADDATLPVLGYSDNGTFDEDNLPPALEYWLGEYRNQIEYARSIGTTRASSPERVPGISLPSSWSRINPMITTIWNQGAPFNNLCPEYNKQKTYTGCVATSMAQVMNYFKYPEKGQGSITYKADYGAGWSPQSVTYSMNFSDVTFDWANMLNSYNGTYTDAQATAVATLMKACGYSVQMLFSPYSSGAVSGYIPGSLVKYFGYDPSAYFVSRSSKTYTEWATLIYNNLKNVGPVIYDGDSPKDGGHSFICDGYDGNGYFHFNWGWGGMSDGYFLLDVLDPAGIGIGGADGGFNYIQDVVLNIQKPKAGTVPAEEKVVLGGSVYGSNTSSYLYVNVNGTEVPGFRYYGDASATFNVGAILEEVNSGTKSYVTANNNNIYQLYMPLDPGYVIPTTGEGQQPYPYFMISRLGLKDNVKYKLTLAYQPNGSSNWEPLETGVGLYNYFYFTKNGNNFTFENQPILEFECTNLELTSTLYDGNAVKVSVTLKNTSNTELTRGAQLVLIDSKGEIAYTGDSFVTSLSPNQSYSRDYISTLDREASGKLSKATPFYLGLFDIDTNTLYYQSTNTVTMEPNPGNPTFTLDLTLENERMENDVYYVFDALNFNAVATLSVTKGIFSQPMSLYLMKIQSQNAYGTTYRILSTYTLPIQVVNAGESVVINTPISFPEAMIGEDYYMGIQSENAKDFDSNIIEFIPESLGAGVEAISIGGDEILFIYDRASRVVNVTGGENGIAQVDAYYLNGMKAPVKVEYLNDNAIVDLSGLGKGFVIINATDKAGKRKSMKSPL